MYDSIYLFISEAYNTFPFINQVYFVGNAYLVSVTIEWQNKEMKVSLILTAYTVGVVGLTKKVKLLFQDYFYFNLVKLFSDKS